MSDALVDAFFMCEWPPEYDFLEVSDSLPTPNKQSQNVPLGTPLPFLQYTAFAQNLDIHSIDR